MDVGRMSLLLSSLGGNPDGDFIPERHCRFWVVGVVSIQDESTMRVLRMTDSRRIADRISCLKDKAGDQDEVILYDMAKRARVPYVKDNQ